MLMVCFAAPLRAQIDASAQRAEHSAVPPTEIVSAYLERLGLKRLQAEDLAHRVASASGEQRVAMAERLAKLYVELFTAAESPDDRRLWESRSRELLRMVPDADTFELRLSLNKALYIQAEDTLEKYRLRLVGPVEAGEAERILRTLKPQLEEMGTKVNRKIENDEAREEKGDSSEKLAEELSEARRIRSQAFYYAGWCAYYLAFLTGADEPAADALKDFGWLLNSRGSRVASIERLPAGLLKYDHVARAAIGCGLATAIRGNETLAIRWFDMVEQAEELPDSIKPLLLSRRITVLAGAKHWADLERLIRLARHSDRAGGGDKLVRLPVATARLLAVVTLEADKSASKDIIEPLAAIALGDLVALGEIGHVLDLVKRYGTAPIGDTGFIVHHVRGLQQYEKARAAHILQAQSGAPPTPPASTKPNTPAVRTTGSDAKSPSPAVKQPIATDPSPVTVDSDKPATDPEVIRQYKDAGILLEAAVAQPDAGSFLLERAKASMLAGQAWYYAGDMVKAADRFTATALISQTKEQNAEAMWLAVISLDRAVEAGDKSLEKRREEAAALFLQTHPEGDRAARLIVRRAMSGLLDAEDAIKILMGVAKESPLYDSARQSAARLLYTQFRTARGSDKDFAAMRFVAVAEEVLAVDRHEAVEGNEKESQEAAQRVIIRVRQILDALLSGQNPDAVRAEAALEILKGVGVKHQLNLSAYDTELRYRRLQIALAKDDMKTANELCEQLQSGGGQYALAADQLLYRRALARKQRGQGGPDAAVENGRELVRLGMRLIDRMKAEPGSDKNASVLSLQQTVSATAFEIFETSGDAAMRDLSIRLDGVLLAAQPTAEQVLRRLAKTSESAGDVSKALDCWRTLTSGLEAGTPAWFEAKYNSIRLLAKTDIARARQVIKQHAVLYPGYGPEPWGEKIKVLDKELGPAAEPATPPPSPSTEKNTGGGK